MSTAMLTNSTRCDYMKKFKYREMRVQGTWLSGSKGRWSYTSREVVLFNDGKKGSRWRLGAIFKSIRKVAKSIVDFVLALGNISKLALFLMNKFNW